MIQPQLAPIRPRVVSTLGDELPLEHEIQRYLDRGACGTIALVGPPGSGKTTALRHLAATFAADGRVGLLDAGETAPFDQTDTKQLVVYVPAAAPPRRSHVDAYLMAPWTRDDLIEYLLACHRERCA